MSKPIADNWFGIEQVDDHLLRIREIHIDPFFGGHMWLVDGRQSALLIDTGSGIKSLRAILSSITSKPISAVALNCFYDHAGGLHEFDEQLAHEADAAAIENPNGLTSATDEYVSDAMLLALPSAGYSTRDYRLRPTTITRRLQHGEFIELGDYSFEVIHTPGVTQGSICLWEKTKGTLFTSDTLFLGPKSVKALPRNHKQYIQSLERLSTLPASVVHPGHFDSFGRETMEQVISSYH